VDSPILSSAETRAAEKAAFARGVDIEALMDQAGAGVARAVRKFFPNPGKCLVYAGKGHNGGDALVAAEHLARSGWKIDIHLAFPESECSELTRKKLHAARGAAQASGCAQAALPPLVVLDGLLGLGANRVLRDPVRAAAREINRLRRRENGFIFAVDVPTGLDSDSGEADSEDCVTADVTVTIAFAKHGLIVDETSDFVGRLEIVPLAELRAGIDSPPEIAASADSLRLLVPHRKFSAYKNQFGRIGVVAGSRGFIGAALLTTQGGLRSGAGLVELFVLEEIYPIVAAMAPIEAMVKPVQKYGELLDHDIAAWALGPGLGQSRSREILELIKRAEQPMVVDADGLNVLSSKIDILHDARGPRLLTPHTGEMRRLFDPSKMPRAAVAKNFCEKFPVTLLFKGSRTIVAERNKPISYNTTGNPGMASGGMGDVLTGVCAALVGQGLSLFDAARVGAWICGRAAEMSIFHSGQSEESLLARDVLDHLGPAFNELRASTV
jgi:ADP-dependent NAD(P)H-hydrate dehydratase / NAD(P)H-hydrate epimerase